VCLKSFRLATGPPVVAGATSLTNTFVRPRADPSPKLSLTVGLSSSICFSTDQACFSIDAAPLFDPVTGRVSVAGDVEGGLLGEAAQGAADQHACREVTACVRRREDVVGAGVPVWDERALLDGDSGQSGSHGHVVQAPA
jgi:hypothetical protein